MRWILLDVAIVLVAVVVLAVVVLGLWRKVKALGAQVAAAGETVAKATEALARAQASGPLGAPQAAGLPGAPASPRDLRPPPAGLVEPATGDTTGGVDTAASPGVRAEVPRAPGS